MYEIYSHTQWWRVPSRLFLRMKATGLLLLMLLPGVYAKEAKSQIAVSRNALNLEQLSNVMGKIEQRTGYLFVYDPAEIDLSRQVIFSYEGEMQPIEKVLANVFRDTGIDFFLEGKNILLKMRDRSIQQQEREIKGRVTDQNGEPIPGVVITVVGTLRGVIIDVDGTFQITVSESENLEFSFIGMVTQVVEVGTKERLDVVLLEQTEELENVTVVAFGKQKKESVISSIATVNVQELRAPTSNLTTAMAGRIVGMISYQTTGEPGQDNAEFFIRGITSFGTGKVDPLILIDNVEVSTHDLSRMHPDDIQSFSILKDATATALYGA